MSTRGLQSLLATTLTEAARKDLLLRRSPAAYDGFDFSPEERRCLLAIEARTLEDFAAQAHRLFYGEDLLAEEEAGPQAVRSVLQELDCA